MLSRDAKMDDVAEYTAIGKETHRQFFHLFLSYSSSVLFNKYVITPNKREDLLPHLQQYARKGLHGAVGTESTEPNDFMNLVDPSTLRYLEGGGGGFNFVDDALHDDPAYKNGRGFPIPVNRLGMDTFRTRLVRHFAICKSNGLANW